MNEAGSEDILIKNWVGGRPIAPLVQEILDREKELIGDNRDRLLKYIYRE